MVDSLHLLLYSFIILISVAEVSLVCIRKLTTILTMRKCTGVDKKKPFESDVWKNNESINETITVLKGISLITKAKGTGFDFSGEHVK